MGGAKEGTQQQLDALRADLADRDRTITALEEEQLLWQQEKTRLQQDVGSLKDKLNVSEVLVQCIHVHVYTCTCRPRRMPKLRSYNGSCAGNHHLTS